MTTQPSFEVSGPTEESQPLPALPFGQYASAAYGVGNDIEVSIQTGAPITLDSEYPIAMSLKTQIDTLIAAARKS
jgi:hypothetical protein